VVLYVSAVAVQLLVFLSIGGMSRNARPELLVVETATGAGVVALVAVVVALGRGRSMLGRSVAVLLALSLVTPVALFAWKLGVSSRFAAMTDAWPERRGFVCLRLSCGLSAWPLVAVVLMRRGSDPVHPHLTGAALGAAVGACSWVFVDLWCPVAYVPHLVLGHALPLVLTILAGAWLGRFIAVRHTGT
jgi:hypothetical protein